MITFIIGGLLIGGAVALALWDKIREWVEKSVFPFFDKHFPGLAPTMREAFHKIDDVAVNIRNGVRAAWKKIRSFLVAAITEIEKISPSKYLKKIKNYLIDDPSSKKLTVQTTEETILHDDLPKEIREKFIVNNAKLDKFDAVEERDKELLQMAS